MGWGRESGGSIRKKESKITDFSGMSDQVNGDYNG